MQIFAQDDEFEEERECVRTLAKAQKLYDEGLIEKIEQLLKPCLEGTELTKDEKLDGYKLLAMAHLYDGNEEESEAAMLMFLKLDPEYQLQPGIDPKEFSELYANYHTSPLYTVGLHIGLNWGSPQSYKEFGAYNTASDKKSYSSSFAIQGGLKVSRYIYKGLNVHLGIDFNQNNYQYSHEILESFTGVNPNNDPVSSSTYGVTIDGNESHSSISIPLSFSYTFLLQKDIRPYALLGFDTRFLLSASSDIKKTYADQSIAAVETGSFENFKDNRTGTNFAGIIGVGGKYKIPGGDIFLEARYYLGITNQVQRDAVDVNDDARLWTYFEQDNDYTLNNLMISVGYNRYLYKPRKMKQPKDATEIDAPVEVKESKKDSKKSKEENPPKQRQVIE